MNCKQCQLDKFFVNGKEGVRCYTCEKTFIEADITNPTAEALKEYKEKSDNHNATETN